MFHCFRSVLKCFIQSVILKVIINEYEYGDNRLLAFETATDTDANTVFIYILYCYITITGAEGKLEEIYMRLGSC